jgi:hypothetical protein
MTLFLTCCRFFPTPNNRKMKEINGEIEGTLRGMIEKRECAMKGEASGNDAYFYSRTWTAGKAA